jgi:2'-5' RNA ligase
VTLKAARDARADEVGPSEPSGVDTLVLGVVIDLPEPLAGQLRAHREAIGDPQVDAIPAHVTLLPPTAVVRDRLAGVEEHLAAVAAAAAPFAVRLDGASTFRPVSPVVYVRVVDGEQSLDDVQCAVRSGPLARDLEFPFHPHVTVAHKLDDAVLDEAMHRLADYAAAFEVDAFLLYEQGPDGAWQPRRRYAFGGGAPP